MNNLFEWWFDESIKFFLLSWYWPNFVMGNADEWTKHGVTLNGIRSIKC